MIQLSMELEKIKEYIDILDEREKEVIVKRFGLGLDKEDATRDCEGTWYFQKLRIKN